MAFKIDREYRVKNAAGLEVDVPGEVLVSMALQNENVTVDGVPVRDYVRENVDREDTIRRAHDQGLPLQVPAPKSESDEILELRKLEAELVANVALEDEIREDRDVGAFAAPANFDDRDGRTADMHVSRIRKRNAIEQAAKQKPKAEEQK